MKLWTITAVIETESDYGPREIASQINRDLNRGDGLYMRVARPKQQIKPKAKRQKRVGTQYFPVY